MILSGRPLYLVAGLVATLMLGGCATTTTTTTWLRPVQPTPKKIQKRVHPGDKVVITTKADKKYTLEVAQITKDSIIGASTLEEQKEVTIPFEQIEAIHVERLRVVPTPESRAASGAQKALLGVLFVLIVLALAI